VVFPGVWSSGGTEPIGLALGFTASALLPLAIMLLSRPGHPQPIVSYCLITIFMRECFRRSFAGATYGDIPPVAWLKYAILPSVATYATTNDLLLRPEGRWRS